MRGGPGYAHNSATAEHVARHADAAVSAIDEALAGIEDRPDVRLSLYRALRALENLT